jgi:hypothetical protein
MNADGREKADLRDDSDSRDEHERPMRTCEAMWTGRLMPALV